MEEKKLVRIGDIGKNTAEVFEESRPTNSEDAKYSESLIGKSAAVFKPASSKYLGSAVVHYYSDESWGGNPKFTVACQVYVKRVSEHHADFGWKQLKSALMKAFGRAEPKVRK